MPTTTHPVPVSDAVQVERSARVQRVYCSTQAGGAVHLAHPDALSADCGRRIGTLARNAEVSDVDGQKVCEQCEGRAFDRWVMAGGRVIRVHNAASEPVR